MSHHKRIYVTPAHTKNIFANMKREEKGFSGTVTPLFQTMMVQAQEEMAEGSANPTDPHHTPTITQPSTSQPQKKQPRRKQRKDTEVSQPSGPKEPMAYETKNVESVPTHSNDQLLNGEDSLKLNELMKLCTTLQKKVLDLETSKTTHVLEIESLKRRVKRLKKKQRSRTHKLRRLYKVGLSAKVISSDDEGLGDQEDESKQERIIDNIDVDEGEVFAEQDVVEKEISTVDLVTTAGEVVTTASVEVSAATTITTTVDELTLAQTLIEIKAAKSKDKGKAKMTKPKKPLKKKDQIMYDQEEEEANIALIESLDNTQAMMDADRLLAKGLQAKEQEELTDEKKARFRFKNKSFTEIQKLFDKAMTRVNMFVDMDTELVKESPNKDEAEMAQEISSKRAGNELEQEKAKKQKIDDDQEEAKMKELMEFISDEEGITINAIPLSTKPPSIVDYKIIKEGKISIYQIIRADGSSKRYSVVIHMLKNFDRKDLETLWKIVKARHGYTRPEEGYERVLWVI
ncbi:hypothetical protein Tco_1348904 [Tanacetum coccineum]